jgi:hypothetical protein
MSKRHEQRTVEWGNWGITLMDPQPDRTKNYGVIAGSVYFPVSTRGPIDADKGKYRAMCEAWIADRAIPDGFFISRAA